MKIKKIVAIFILGISISLLTGCKKLEEYDYSGNLFYKELSSDDAESITEDGAIIFVDDNQFFIRLEDDLKYKVYNDGEHELEKEENGEYTYYFVNMGKYTDNKFGTMTPIVYNDKEYGELELDYFGNYDYEITDSKEFTKLYVEILKEEDITLENFVSYVLVEEIANQISELEVDNFGYIPTYFSDVEKKVIEELESKGIKISNLEIERIVLTEESEKIVEKIDQLKMVGSLYIKNNSWIATDGSEMKFGDGTMYWYQTEGSYADNYYYGKYKFYIGREAINYITTELSSYGVTEEELNDLFERNEEYNVENFVVFDFIYDGIVLNGSTTVPNRPQVPWYGFIYENNTKLYVANMNTGTYYSFTRK